MKILLDNGHGSDTIGKASPDGRLREYYWAREIVKMIAERLEELGISHKVIVPETRDVGLAERVRRINNVCRAEGAKNCLLISVHVNAADSDLKWHNAQGWSIFVSKNSSVASKRFAKMMTEGAVRRGLTKGRCVPPEKYWTWSWTPNDIYILKNTNCPAVLTENLFMDNVKDCEYLLSDKGKEEIVDLHIESILKYIGDE